MWYALVQDEQLGPMPAHEVQQLFEQNVIVSETLVWRAGMNDWVALCQLPEFMHLFSEGDKTVAADFDTLFGELDDDDRTMLGEGLDDAPDLGAAVDALLSDAPAAAAPEAPTDAAPDLPDDEMTIGVPAPPMLPKRPAPPSPFGKPKPPSPVGAKPPGLLAPKKAPPAPAPPSPPPPTTEATMELGDGDLLADVLADAARGAAPPSPAPPSPAGGEGTMELGDADLFAGLLDEVGGVEDVDEIDSIESLDSLDEVEVIDEPVVPAAPIPPSPFAAAPQPPTGGGIDFGAPQPPTGGGIDFGAPRPPTGGGINFGGADAATEAAPSAPSPFSGGITSAAAEPPAKGKNKTALLALLLVVLGGGLGAAVLMITSPGDSPVEDAATAAPVVDAAPPEPDAAVPDAAVPDATIDATADAVVDAQVDAVVDAVVDAIVDAKPAPRVATPVRRRTTPRPPPQPKVTKKVMLSRDDIQSVVNGASGKLKGCASSVPAVKGKTVSVFVTINRSGRITRTRVTSASLRGTDAQGCVENTLKTLKFPEFTGDPMSFPLPIKL